MKELTDILKLTFGGATAFWLPHTIWHAVRRDRFGTWDILGDSLLMCSALLAAYIFFKKRYPARPVGVPMMVGVWCLGGFFIMLATSFEHAGFAASDGFWGGMKGSLLGLIPLYTYIMSAYDLSLGALLLANVAAIIIILAQYRSAARRRGID